jgi:hypothetical protein
MNRSGLSRLIPIILVVIVVIVAIAALISVGRMFFGGGDESSPSPTPAANNGKEALKKTTAEYSVKMTVRGPITANETARSYTITVGPSKRNMTTYKGYLSEHIDDEELDNNVQAYTQFVNALSRAKLMDAAPLSGEDNNTKGICATGMLYEFAVFQGTNVVQQLWTSTCKGSSGSLEASVSQVSRLFQVQIPNYYTLVNKARINV